MKKDLLIAIFDDDAPVMDVAHKVREKNIPVYDIYTPFPVHGLDEAMGIKRSFLPYITLFAGIGGLAVAMALQIWTSVVDWPTIIGGKPFNSIPAFIPVAFELTVLFGAHTTVVAFLLLGRLFPGKKPLIFHEDQTSHSFIMAFDKSAINVNDVTTILKEHGALEIRDESTSLD